MPSFGTSSKGKLDTCDKRLIDIMEVVVRHIDCTIICGHRSELAQTEAFEAGNSKVEWPHSKHNSYPSKAVDVAPYILGRGIPWPQEDKYKTKDTAQFYYLQGFIRGIAESMGHKVRFGGNWNGSNDFRQNSFDDTPHVEIVGE